MLIAIIRAHFSAQHAASEDKELSTNTHKVREKGIKTERVGEREIKEEGRQANAWKRTFYCSLFYMRMGFGKATQITQNEKSA